MLMATLIVLICGLLFYVDAFPSTEFKQFVQVVAIGTMVGSTVFVILMIFWDASTRKKKYCIGCFC